MSSLNETRPKAHLSLKGDETAYLEVQKAGSSRILTLSLSGGRHLLGRNTSLPFVLDDESVSRLHAALVLDPFNRWWIHDLGSTNGTFVNGTSVTRRLLNSADTIRIGAFSLVLRMRGEIVEKPATLPPPNVASQNVADFRTTTRLLGMNASGLTMAIAQDAIAHARSLLRFEEDVARLRALCEFAVGDRFLGLWTAVFRIHRDPPCSLRVGPLARAAFGDSFSGLEVPVEALCAEHRELFFHDAGPHVFDSPSGPKEVLVACTLDRTQDAADVLLIQYARTRDSGQWPSVVALLAESYRLAHKLWEGRRQSCLHAAIEHELEMARALQDSLVPSSSVPIPGLDLAIGYEPSRWVGGDYADVVRISDGRTLLIVADVCGKGLQAALVASCLHTLAHVMVDSCSSLAELAGRMNAHLCRFLPEHSFVTMVLVAIDTKRRLLECVNLGHPPPVLIRPDGSTSFLQSRQNIGLGMAPLEVRSEWSEISPEDVLLLYTDGLCAPEQNEPNPCESSVLEECVQVISTVSDADLDIIGEKLAQFVSLRKQTMESGDDVAFWLARLAPDTLPASTGGRFHRVTAIPPQGSPRDRR